MKKVTLLTMLLLFIGFSMMAQNSTQGKEFWFSYMENGYKYNNNAGWVENTVMVSAKRACTGTIAKPDGSLPPITFSVEDDGITYIDIPEMYAYNQSNSEVVSNKSLVLRATDTVSVYISNVATFSFDASFILPVESLGSEYIIQCGQQSIAEGGLWSENIETSAFLIIAVEDGTVIDITPSTETEQGVFPDATVTVTLNEGETFFVKSNGNSGWRDLSGSSVFVHDEKKVAVFNGNTVTCIPNDVGKGRDHIFEQALPVDSWGQQFAITTSYSRARDFVKITSSANDNRITRNGQLLTTLNQGESFEFDLLSTEGSCFIETTKPSVVYLYNTTGEEPYEPFGSSNGDPSMAWIPPVEQRIDEITFCTFNSDYDLATIDYHYVNIVVDKEAVGQVYFDGSLINAAEFQSVRGTQDYSFVRKEITHGTHHLACELGLIAHVYGFGQARGYAYCVGANVIQLTQKLFVDGTWSGLLPNGHYMCIDDEVSLSVETNYQINHVSWDFGDGQSGEGIETTHQYMQGNDYLATAYILGFNDFSVQTVYDTLSVDIHVGEPEYHDTTMVVCDMDAFEYYGVEYTQSGYYERVGTSIYGCDSTYILTIDMGFTPNFEFVGTHWPIGGSETHFSVNEYAISPVEPRTQIDTVLWQIDCPNWYVVPHGDKGRECTLYIFSYLLEPVTLHATAINRCDTIHEEFFIKTSYYGVNESVGDEDFTVSPNPSDGHFTLHFGDLAGRVDVAVYNTLGQKVDAFSVDANLRKEMAYTLPDLKNGLYYFVMNCNGASVTRKVMLVR